MRSEEKNSPLPIIDDPLTHLFNYNYYQLNFCLRICPSTKAKLCAYMYVNWAKILHNPN